MLTAFSLEAKGRGRGAGGSASLLAPCSMLPALRRYLGLRQAADHGYMAPAADNLKALSYIIA